MKSKQELIEEWESAIEAAEFYGKGKEERLISYMKDFVSDLKQLDEPEILSQEFINGKAVEVYADTADAEVHVVFRMRDLQNLLVPKQELPVIPKLVAETIEEDKERGYDVYDSIDLIIETDGGGLTSISDWVARNIDKYARAYLTGRYEVEEEQKFYVLNENKQLMLKKNEGEVKSAYNSLRGVGENYLTFYQLTEQDIKDYDERYWPFAVKVEELEE